MYHRVMKYIWFLLIVQAKRLLIVQRKKYTAVFRVCRTYLAFEKFDPLWLYRNLTGVNNLMLDAPGRISISWVVRASRTRDLRS